MEIIESSSGKNHERALFQCSRPANAEAPKKVIFLKGVKEENLPKRIRKNGSGNIRNDIEG